MQWDASILTTHLHGIPKLRIGICGILCQILYRGFHFPPGDLIVWHLSCHGGIKHFC